MKQITLFLAQLVNSIFLERNIYTTRIPVSKHIFYFLTLFGLFYLTSLVIFADHFRGFDWIHFWGIKRIPPYYPPWTYLVIQLLNWHTLTAITLAAVSYASLLRAKHIISTSLVFFTLPLWWTLYLGQLDGIAVLGLLGLPWLTPLALINPQLSFFAFAAKKTYLIGLLVFLLVTLMIWGLWPLQVLNVNLYHTEGKFEQDISIGIYGIVIALPLLWLSRGDMDMMMLSGAFCTPHLIPYTNRSKYCAGKAFISVRRGHLILVTFSGGMVRAERMVVRMDFCHLAMDITCH